MRPSGLGSEVVIRAENLGKRYRLGRARYATLRETLMGALGGGASRGETIWALDDVSFEVRRGEAVGIIGRNGAGKSTLLKILARVTEPTRGDGFIRGRVGSLLEVGTGFHPELTGRENIFLNGVILGMKKEEVRRRFDEIVSFAEVEAFLDTAVKHYSSGMYTRLAFSVAAHLEPEILLVDEVLAVGDAAFQRKCLGKMGEAGLAGRTVLFVSHNLGMIGRLCPKTMLLSGGKLEFHGDSATAIERYLGLGGAAAVEWRREGPFPEKPHFRRLVLCDADGKPCSVPTSGEAFGVRMDVCLPRPVPRLLASVDVINRDGLVLFTSSPIDVGVPCPTDAGLYRARVVFPKGLFMPKTFAFRCNLYHPDGTELFDCVASGLTAIVTEVSSLANVTSTGRLGDLQIPCRWSGFEPLADSPADDVVRCGREGT